MAKKRGRKRKNTKDTKLEHELPGGFWRQVMAVLMIAVAIFCVVTWFGQGGSALNQVHYWASYAIGAAVYVLPVLLIYLAVKIFRSDTNRVPIVVWIASFLMAVWVSGIAGIWDGGGVVGEWLNGLTSQILAKSVVIFIYIIL